VGARDCGESQDIVLFTVGLIATIEIALQNHEPPLHDVEAFEKAQSREPDVRIVIYDDILERQRYLLR
jgi:hypothetical protein